MGAVTIQQMADRVGALMDQRLGTKGNSLSVRLRQRGRALPRAIRGEADLLARAAEQSAHPKLVTQIDEARVTQAYEACLRHLQGLDRGALARGTAMGIASSIAFRLFVVGALVFAVLVWRGLI